MKLIDLSKNKNPYYPTRTMLSYLKKNIKYISKYPEQYTNVEGFGFFKSVNNEHINVVNGTLEGMDLLLKCLQKDTIGVFKPTFWGITYVAERNKYNIAYKDLKENLDYDLKDINQLAKKVDVIYICNSNNPTLAYIEKKDLVNIINKNKHCHFIIDETVLAFDENYNAKTLIEYVKKCNNLSVLVSCSKIFGISGLRTGIVVTNEELHEKLLKNSLIYSNNTLAQIFMKKFHKELFNLCYSRKKVKRNFDYFISNLNMKMVKRFRNNNGSFVLIDFEDSLDSEEIGKFLKQHGVIVAIMRENYPEMNGNWIRVSAGKTYQLKKLNKLLNKYYKNKIRA